jgi:hypothetical protein
MDLQDKAINDGRSEIRWSPRVPQWKIQRLYESDAQGLLDEELLDDVGITLWLRCRDILTIHEAKDLSKNNSVLFPGKTRLKMRT